MTTPTPTAATRATRLLYVDNLRVALTVLVVLHHVAVTYGNIPLWYYTEPATDPSGVVLDVFVVLNQAWFMGLFFLIAGHFTPGAHDRKGGAVFLRDRLIRLGIPLLGFLILLRPLLNIDSFFSSGMNPVAYYVVSWDPGPMWFVEVLLVFVAVYALLRRGRAAPAAPAEARPPGALIIIGFVLALSLLTVAWRFLVPVGSYFPIVGLPTPAQLPQYAALFAVGVIAFRRGWFSALPRRAGWIGLASAVVVTAALLPLTVTTTGLVQSLAQALWENAFAVSVIIGLLVLFRECIDSQGPLRGFLSRNAFAVYVVHPLVLVGLGHAFGWLEAPAVAKFALVGVLALPLCWALGAGVRALPGARKVL